MVGLLGPGRDWLLGPETVRLLGTDMNRLLGPDTARLLGLDIKKRVVQFGRRVTWLGGGSRGWRERGSSRGKQGFGMEQRPVEQSEGRGRSTREGYWEKAEEEQMWTTEMREREAREDEG